MYVFDSSVETREMSIQFSIGMQLSELEDHFEIFVAHITGGNFAPGSITIKGGSTISHGHRHLNTKIGDNNNQIIDKIEKKRPFISYNSSNPE